MNDYLLLFIAYWLGSFLAMMVWMKRNKKDADWIVLVGVAIASVLLLPLVIFQLTLCIYKALKR